MNGEKQVVGIETSAVDIIYPERESALRTKFLELFPWKEKGNCCVTDPDEFVGKVLAFATANNVQFTGATDAEKVKSILSTVLGEPEVKAGGALANTFHLMANCKVNGEKLLPKTTFYCTVGDDEVAKVFTESLEGHIAFTQPENTKTTIVHVIPVKGERLMIPIISLEYTCDKKFEETIDEIKKLDFTKVSMFMIGGYFWYTQRYGELVELVAKKLEAISDKKDRPTIVFTAACDFISETPVIREALDKLKCLAKIIVFANAEEFRKLIGKDMEWRKAAQPDSPHYMRIKAIANDNALSYAFQEYCWPSNGRDVTFVVTNGEHGVRIASNNGVTESHIPPKPTNPLVNTVGAGDVFAGGYIVGEAMGLSTLKKLRLGFVAAEVVICQSDARLPVKANGNVDGLLAYLDPTKASDKELLNDFTKQNKAITLQH